VKSLASRAKPCSLCSQSPIKRASFSR
jgi:hypothetical protein